MSVKQTCTWYAIHHTVTLTDDQGAVLCMMQHQLAAVPQSQCMSWQQQAPSGLQTASLSALLQADRCSGVAAAAATSRTLQGEEFLSARGSLSAPAMRHNKHTLVSSHNKQHAYKSLKAMPPTRSPWQRLRLQHSLHGHCL